MREGASRAVVTLCYSSLYCSWGRENLCIPLNWDVSSNGSGVKKFWPGLGQPFMVWVWVISSKIVKFFNFFPSDQKNLFGSDQKVPGSKAYITSYLMRVKSMLGLGRVGSGPISRINLLIEWVTQKWMLYVFCRFMKLLSCNNHRYDKYRVHTQQKFQVPAVVIISYWQKIVFHNAGLWLAL